VTALKASQVDAFIAGKGPDVPIVLVYGKDPGLVTDRVQTLMARALSGADDPFARVDLDGDDIASAPDRLPEEAHAISMFGGRRVIRLRHGSRQLVEAVRPLLSTPPRECLVIIEAGDLKKGAPLLTLLEGAPGAVTLPCYPDEGRDLSRMIAAATTAAGFTIEDDALRLLSSSLGADRLQSKAELEKLMLFCSGRTQITLADVEAVVSDAAPLSLDTIVDQAVGGDISSIDEDVRRACLDGARPDVLLGQCLRHLLVLRRLRLDRDAGEASSAIVRRAGLHFRRQPLVEQQIELWPLAKLDKAIGLVSDAMFQARSGGHRALSVAVAVRALWSMALAARR
jgi:DNA polymerase-3 subunit delta